MTDIEETALNIPVQAIPDGCHVLDVTGTSHIEAVHLLIKQIDHAKKTHIPQIAVLTGRRNEERHIREREAVELVEDQDFEAAEGQPTLFHSIGKTLVLSLKKRQISSCQFLDPTQGSGYLITL